MSDAGNNQNPPVTRAPAPAAPASSPPPAGVSRTALIWIGVAVVVLSFVAAFLGSYLARSSRADEPAPTVTVTAEPTPEPEETASPDYEAIIKDVLPAGSAVRAGTGAPDIGQGLRGRRLHRSRDGGRLALPGRLGVGGQHQDQCRREPDR